MKIEKKDLLYFKFDRISSHSGVIGASFSRLGGVSKKPYESLNLGVHVKDSREDVLYNRKLALNELGFELENLIAMEQVHSNNLTEVSLSDAGRGAFSWDDAIPSTDGMISKDKDIILMAVVADCSVVVFYDPVKEACGIGHCGWRGTVGQLPIKIIKEMGEKYGSAPSDLLVGVNACIGLCCCEVGPEVKDMFFSSFGNISESFFRLNKKKHHLNIQEAILHQLYTCGVKKDNIDIIELCTHCRTDLFYSHRAEKGITGRNAVFIGMKE